MSTLGSLLQIGNSKSTSQYGPNGELAVEDTAMTLKNFLIRGTRAERLRVYSALDLPNIHQKVQLTRMLELVLEAVDSGGECASASDASKIQSKYGADARMWSFPMIGKLVFLTQKHFNNQSSNELCKKARSLLLKSCSLENEPFARCHTYAVHGLLKHMYDGGSSERLDMAKQVASIDPTQTESAVIIFAKFAIALEGGDRQIIQDIKKNFQESGSQDLKNVNLDYLEVLTFLNDEELYEPFFNLLERCISRCDRGEWGLEEIYFHDKVARGLNCYISLLESLPESVRDRAKEKFNWLVLEYVRALKTFGGTLFDAILSKVLRTVGYLNMQASINTLVGELSNDNPEIAKCAAQSLERIAGAKAACGEIVKVCATNTGEQQEVLSNALRWMQRDIIVDELESLMSSGESHKVKEASRQLMAELGGSSAIQKMQARQKTSEQFTKIVQAAGNKVQDMFDKSMAEARKGFNIALGMDLALFCVGIVLLAASILLLAQNGSSDPLSAGVSGGSGVLSIIYSLMIAKPRRQVKLAIDHMTYLNVIFLGYLRQLHIVDQSFSRQMVESEVDTNMVSKFTGTIETVMGNAVEALRKMLQETDHQLDHLDSKNSVRHQQLDVGLSESFAARDDGAQNQLAVNGSDHSAINIPSTPAHGTTKVVPIVDREGAAGSSRHVIHEQ